MKKIILTILLSMIPLMAQVDSKVEVPYIPFSIKMGKGFNAVQANCIMCHSFGYILNQGRQSRKFWRGKIDKMIIEFKAPMTKKDAKIVEDYLVEQYGNEK